MVLVAHRFSSCVVLLCVFTHLVPCCVVLLCVFTHLVPCCDVRDDFHIKTMFGFSLPPVVCSRTHVLLTLFVYSGVEHILCCVFCFVGLHLVLCVPNVAIFSGLSILDYSFGIL